MLTLKPRILLVDDDAYLRRGLERILHPYRDEWELAFEADGDKALKLLSEAPCDVVVTDIFMPEKEGLETIMSLRREHPATKIIAMSGGGQRGLLLHVLDIATKLGADYTLHKPFEPQELIAALRQALADPASAPGARRDKEID